MSGGSGEWYALVEEMAGRSDDSEWWLKEKLHVEGGREQALSRAAELSLAYPKDPWNGGPKYGYLVFRTSETSWLIELSDEYWSENSDGPKTFTKHARLSVAQLVASKETPPVEPPAGKKGILRRALGRD
ncbi:hypothetical protein RB628_12430 [Streptomyces sp. ADMS]|uniref:hypothetical protein n=1 Tax=Streptomyces sp. ADMS TaxID=3071415 RepID=UPI00296EACE0|nr:hypothetical protein [Streptomyces sp. ADMS]MDW4906124.1 hypothetical protein [Streptomyces sp. ADMS]